jgi:hypothetical protein
MQKQMQVLVKRKRELDKDLRKKKMEELRKES